MLHLQFLSHDKSWSQIFLTGIFVFLSVILLITITVMIVFLVQISTEKVFDKTVEKFLSERNHHIDQKTISPPSSHSGTYLKPENIQNDDRTPCYNTCWPYTAFRFESECRHGYCYCKGNGYNNLTCLPIFGDCIISKNPSNVVAFFRGINQTTFGCYTSPNSKRENQSQVYVISVMNENRSHHTLTVNVTMPLSAGSSHVKLVLASYFPVHWSVVTHSRLKVDSVIQISTVRAHQGRLSINGKNLTEESEPYIHQRSLVGYGDDRDSGHTIRLLETVQRIAGYFTSFSGAKQADKWQLTIRPEMTMQAFEQLSNFSITVNTTKTSTDSFTNTTNTASGR